MIRPATADDVTEIGQLWLQLVEHHRKLDATMPAAAQDGSERYSQRLLEHLRNSCAYVFVAEEDGQIVGYALGVIVDSLSDVFYSELSGFVADLFVSPDYRGRGIGRALVEALAEVFYAKGARHYEWFVAAKNHEGRAFWQALQGREVMIRMRADLDRRTR